VLAGKQIAEGEKVLLYFGAANRDGRVFEDPEDFVLDRVHNPHIAFGGHGPHYCLGSHFARIEGTAMLRQLLTELPDLALAAEPSWYPSNFISGPSHVPVTFTATRRS
jgi:cytochrome P450